MPKRMKVPGIEAQVLSAGFALLADEMDGLEVLLRVRWVMLICGSIEFSGAKLGLGN